MENLPISSKYRSAPGTPVSDGEREQLVGQLNRAFADGQVEASDYQSLLDQVFAATTMGQLAPVAERVPVRSPDTSPGPATPAGLPGQVNDPRPPAQTAKIMAILVGVLLSVVLIALLAVLIF